MEPDESEREFDALFDEWVESGQNVVDGNAAWDKWNEEHDEGDGDD